MAHQLKRFSRILCVLAALPALAFGVVYAKGELFGNIHPLPSGDVYRSGQLSRSQLTDLIQTHGIRSIINLRGGNYDDPWYQDEVTTAKTLGVEHIDYALSAKREISDTQAKNLLALMKTAPKPLLIHCRHGSDRSGFASALYVRYILHAPATQAADQLSWRFGHSNYHYYGKDKMDMSFERILKNPAFEPSIATGN